MHSSMNSNANNDKFLIDHVLELVDQCNFMGVKCKIIDRKKLKKHHFTDKDVRNEYEEKSSLSKKCEWVDRNVILGFNAP